MGFPDIHRFPESYPGPYERQMGQGIADLLRLFHGFVPDPKSNARVLELATTPNRWSASHALFDQIRSRLLAAMERKEQVLCAQYSFEVSYHQAVSVHGSRVTSVQRGRGPITWAWAWLKSTILWKRSG
jgi:hypothetical protein